MNRVKDIIKRLQRSSLLMPLVCLAVVLVINVIKTPVFFKITYQNGALYGYIIDIINRASELIILSVGMTFVVASSGGTDISVGSVCAFTGAVMCVMLGDGDTYAVPYLLALGACLVTGALCGAWNGFLVAKLKIQPMVATLIMYTAGRGLSELITDGHVAYVNGPNFELPGRLIPGVPVPTPIIIAAVVVAVTMIVLKKTPLALYVQAVGIKQGASRIVGLHVERIIFLTYVLCSLYAAIASVIVSSRVTSLDARYAGLNLELDAILAVALGGNSLGGGKFNLWGTVIGAVTIQALTTSLYAMGVSSEVLPVYKAAAVIIIIALQTDVVKGYLKKFNKKNSDRKEAAA